MSARPNREPWLVDAVRAGADLRVQNVPAWRNNLINLSALAFTLSAGVALLLAAPLAPWWVYVPVASVAFGLVWFATFILVVHEASHGMFLRAADRSLQARMNEIAGWLVCLPLTVHFERHWLVGHHIHHRDPLREADPQNNIHQGRELLLTCLGLVFVPGYAFVVRFVKRRTTARSSHTSPMLLLAFPLIWIPTSAIVATHFGAAAAFALFHGIAILVALNELKGALEHGGTAGQDDPLLRSRTSDFPARALVMPWNISLHFEHHLDPQVPWYHLGIFHRRLRARLPPDAQSAVFDVPLLHRLA